RAAVGPLGVVWGGSGLGGLCPPRAPRLGVRAGRPAGPSRIGGEPRRVAAGRSRVLMLLALAEIVSAAGPRKAISQTRVGGGGGGGGVAATLALAGSTFASGDATAPGPASPAGLALAPENSRAAFRLAVSRP